MGEERITAARAGEENAELGDNGAGGRAALVRDARSGGSYLTSRGEVNDDGDDESEWESGVSKG